MTDLETRLRDGLARAAEEAPGDPDRVRAAVRRRLRPGARPRPTAARLVLPLAAALVVVGGTAGVSRLLDRGEGTGVASTPTTSPSPTSVPVAAAVSTTWACAQRRTVDLTHTLDGPGVRAADRLPMRVRPGAAPAEAGIYGVARFAYALQGDRGSLAYGDAEGRRTAVTTLGRDADGTWRVRTRTLCSGPGSDPAATGADADILSPRRQAGLRPPTTVSTTSGSSVPVDPARLVPVDHRTTYDQVGRPEPASTYAYFDGHRMTILGTWGDTRTWGSSSEQTLTGLVAQGSLPVAATQDPFIRLTVDEVARGTSVPVLVHGTGLRAVELRAGDVVLPAQEFHAAAWGPTRLFAVLAPARYQGDSLRQLSVVVTRTDGSRTTYPVR